MSRTTIEDRGLGNWRWLLPLILLLVIAAVILGAYFVTHHHSTSASPTRTPTPTATAVPRKTATPVPTATGAPRATATAKPAPTGTPRPGPTGTPRPGPTATSRPGPTGTAAPAPTRTPLPGPTATPAANPTSTSGGGSAAGGPQTGTFAYNPAALRSIQKAVAAGNSSFTYYTDPYKVLQKLIGAQFGFTGALTILSPPPPPQPTATPYNNSQGLPQIAITVQYQGKKYVIVLDQPETQGAQGIWVIVSITAK